MRTRMLTAAVLMVGSALGAQVTAPPLTPELRPFVGAYVPTGAMRDDFKAATMLGAQVALEVNRNFHVLGTAGWAHGHNKFGLGSDRTNIWQYDAGVEANLVRSLAATWLFRPFVGVGAGGRTYDYRVDGVKTQTCTAGYGTVGSELQTGAVALRVEARDYLTCFKSPLTGKNRTRNDLGLSLGVAYHLR
jgi:hypothetical protein